MALTKKETAGAMKVLKMLAHDELMSLAKTVTKGQLSFSSLEGKFSHHIPADGGNRRFMGKIDFFAVFGQFQHKIV